jgi:hypothetical protein
MYKAARCANTKDIPPRAKAGVVVIGLEPHLTTRVVVIGLEPHSGSALKIQPAPPGMSFGVHIDLITSMANLEGLFLYPRYPRPPGAPPW